MAEHTLVSVEILENKSVSLMFADSSDVPEDINVSVEDAHELIRKLRTATLGE